MNTLSALRVSLILVMMVASPCWGCSCGSSPQPRDARASTDAVFRGTVLTVLAIWAPSVSPARALTRINDDDTPVGPIGELVI